MKSVLNKKASFNYNLLENFEAGVVLTGNEIKQVRAGKASLEESFVTIRNGEASLVNAHIAPYEKGVFESGGPRRSRKLLLHKKEIDYLFGKLAGSNLTVIPTKLYFRRGFAKIQIALAYGKKKYDKREAIKKREGQREAQSLLRKAKLVAQQQSKN
ncbi:MAG: SsrA-binding protein SmpB [bacterium]|nr:SsrA-binding protein SmpB [bacterium]